MNHLTRLPGALDRLLKRNFLAAGNWLFRRPDEMARACGWVARRTAGGLGRRYHDPHLAERLAQHAGRPVPATPARGGPGTLTRPGAQRTSAADTAAWARWSR